MQLNFEDVPLFMTPGQLAHVTGEHAGPITRGIREGRIPADKVNRRWRICRDVVFPTRGRGTAAMVRATTPSAGRPSETKTSAVAAAPANIDSLTRISGDSLAQNETVLNTSGGACAWKL